MGSIKQSEASKRYWKKIPAEKRKALMVELAKKRIAKLSPEQRSAIATNAITTRWANKKKKK